MSYSIQVHLTAGSSREIQVVGYFIAVLLKGAAHRGPGDRCFLFLEQCTENNTQLESALAHSWERNLHRQLIYLWVPLLRKPAARPRRSILA